MAEFPDDLRFMDTHEWGRLDADGLVTVGISDHAQHELGDVVFVELPEVDTEVAARDEVAVVESVKAASDIYSPVSGTVVAINEAPEVVNDSPYGDGWFFKIIPSDIEEFSKLLSADEYRQVCETEPH